MNDLNESQLIPVLLFLSKGQKNNVHTQVAWTTERKRVLISQKYNKKNDLLLRKNISYFLDEDLDGPHFGPFSDVNGYQCPIQ